MVIIVAALRLIAKPYHLYEISRIYTVVAFGGCHTKSPEEKLKAQFLEDSIKSVVHGKVDSIMKKATHDAFFDTTGLYQAPVKILSAKLVKREYSTYRDISLSYKNVSSQKISAVRFKWYGLNAFNEPADMGECGIAKGFGGGYTDESLLPNKSSSGTWGIMSKDGKKIVLAWTYEVMFEDGSSWKIGR